MDGYTRLAALVGRQNEYGIFRRYMSLRALRLAYMSAEITHLAEDLGVVVEMDRASDDPERSSFEFYYQCLHESHGHPDKSAQRKLWDILSIRLREYGEDLLLYRQLSQLPSANQSHLSKFRAWLKEADGGHRFLHGAEALVWDKDFEHDLTSLCVPIEPQDAVTKGIYSTMLPLYHRFVGERRKTPLNITDPFNGKQQQTPIFEYSDKVIMAVVNIFSAALASLIPSISALVLYFIHSALGRLGAIVAFTFVFSTVLCLITTVKRSECFGIMAAFSAVLVVFVGNSDGMPCHCPER